MSKLGKGILIIIILAIIGVIIWGISKKQGKEEAVTKEPIKIGAILSLTGDASQLGEYAKNGIESAVKSINDAGGIEGRNIEVSFEDGANNSTSTAEKLIRNNGIQGIIGGTSYVTAKNLVSASSTKDITTIYPVNFRISGQFELNNNSFTLLPDLKEAMGELKEYISDKGIKRLAVVHSDSILGKGIASSLDSIMKDNGQKGIVEKEYSNIESGNIKTIVSSLKAQKVDAVFIDMSPANALSFVQEAKKAGLKALFISYNNILGAFANKEDKNLIEGAVVMKWDFDGYDFIKGKYGDAVYVLAQGITGASNASDTASYISQTTFTAPSGTIKFTPNHALESKPISISIIKDGQVTPYKQSEVMMEKSTTTPEIN